MSLLCAGNTSEWPAATSLLITNAANLMNSIKDVLKASKSAHELPNNYLDTTQLHSPGHLPSLSSFQLGPYPYPRSLPPHAQPAPHTPSLPPQLHIEDTGVVYKSLYSLRAKWTTLGTFLHINQSSLEVIKEDNDSSDDKLRELVALWLRRNTPAATWQALYEAVENIDPYQAQLIRGMAEGSGTMV